MATRRSFLKGSLAAGAAGVGAVLLPNPAQADIDDVLNDPDAVTVALLGDYGSGLVGEQQVADLIHSWNPAAVFTMGDNVYSADGKNPYELLERRVVSYYRRFVDSGTFYPSLGNHDWGDPGTPLLEFDGQGGTRGAWHDVFDLPGNGRYFDVRIGSMHAFVIDDYYLEPDGHFENSVQALWLKRTAEASDAAFKFVVHHFAPYVSSHNAQRSIRWPFRQWGIDASFSGHWHHFERRVEDGVTYIVNGLGGAPFGFGGTPDAGTLGFYAAKNGASRLTVTPSATLHQFISFDGVVRDSVILNQIAKPNPEPDPEPEPPRPPAEPGLPQIDEQYRNATGRSATIARLYLAAFERNPDDDGHQYWVGQRVSTAAIAAYFITSAEFQLRYGNLNNDRFVERVYANVLGRSPDDDGFRYWTGLLASGFDRSDVLLGFSQSEEFKIRTGIVG